jgi:hypothetical protein
LGKNRDNEKQIVMYTSEIDAICMYAKKLLGFSMSSKTSIDKYIYIYIYIYIYKIYWIYDRP